VRIAIDSITGLGVLKGVQDHPECEIVMGYDDGNWPDADQLAQMFGTRTVIRITTNPNDNEGDMLDIEKGDAGPDDAPGWTTRRRVAGHIGPLSYFPDSWRAQVTTAFVDQKVPQGGLFAAAYPGRGAELQEPGDVGHQYDSNNDYDISVVVDYLPGIDPAPTPVQEGEVSVSAAFPWNTQLHGAQVSLGELWHKWGIGTPTPDNEGLNQFAPEKVEFPDQKPRVAIVNGASLGADFENKLYLTIAVEDTNKVYWVFAQAAGDSKWQVWKLS
jgi:hypothetical protein